jgi:O-antigen/teichoic acid export membrane protein
MLKKLHLPRLLSTTIIYFIGNFASKLLSFFLLPIYTAYLTPDDFGQVDVLLSAVPLIAPIFTLQAAETVFRFLCEEKSLQKKKVVITNSLSTFFIGIFAFSFLYIFVLKYYNFQYSIYFFFYFIISYIGLYLLQVLRGVQRNKEYAAMGVITTVCQALANIILIVNFRFHADSLLIAAIFANSVISVIMLFMTRIWEYIDISLISISIIKEQLNYSIPLIPNQICWWFTGALGKYVLLYFYGVNSNGILALASKFPNLISTVNSIFLLAWVENSIHKFLTNDKEKYFSQMFSFFTSAEFAVIILLLPLTKIYYVLTISDKFQDAWIYIPYLYIGALFNGLASFIGSIYTASMKTKYAFSTTIIAALINLIFCFVLIPKLKIYGVVIANIVTFVAFYVIRIFSINKIIEITWDFKNLAINIFFLTVSFFVYFVDALQYQFLAIICFVPILLIINRNYLSQLWIFTQKKVING